MKSTGLRFALCGRTLLASGGAFIPRRYSALRCVAQEQLDVLMDLRELKFDLAEPEEYALVFDSWARSFQKSPWAGCIPNHLYAQVSRAASAEIIDRGAKVIVAYVELPEGRRVVGYSVSEPERGVLHWLFVKHDFRGLGIGKAILAATVDGVDWSGVELAYTYRTRASAKFLGAKWRWEPKYARVKG